jgi:hypothetical protein
VRVRTSGPDSVILERIEASSNTLDSDVPG